jgi:hypothetical protein
LDSLVDVSVNVVADTVPVTNKVEAPDISRKLTLAIVVLGSVPVVFTKKFGTLVNTPVLAPLVPETDPV